MQHKKTYPAKRNWIYSQFNDSNFETESKSIFSVDSLEKNEDSSEVPKMYTLEEKIRDEKRRRNQAYHLLDYQLSLTSYFDFFSKDAFQIAKQSKYLCYLFGEKEVDNLTLFLPFFCFDSNLRDLLQEYQITNKRVRKLVFRLKEKANQKRLEKQFQKLYPIQETSNFWEIIQKSIHFKQWNFLLNFLKKQSKEIKTITNILEKKYSQFEELIEDIEAFFKISDNLSIHETIPFSREVSLIFEKASENALLRFKTPVITAEILFLTLMENSSVGAGRIIEKIVKDKTEWYLLRYRILKRLHASESSVRGEVIKNQQFFAYLLKTQISEKEFQKLIDKNSLGDGVSYFRNTLMELTMQANLSTLLKEEIYNSIRLTSKRRYST